PRRPAHRHRRVLPGGLLHGRPLRLVRPGRLRLLNRRHPLTFSPVPPHGAGASPHLVAPAPPRSPGLLSPALTQRALLPPAAGPPPSVQRPVPSRRAVLLWRRRLRPEGGSPLWLTCQTNVLPPSRTGAGAVSAGRAAVRALAGGEVRWQA